MLTRQEVAGHASRSSCWIIIEGVAYDVTDFIQDHPGGDRAILRFAGRDATMAYKTNHASDTLKKHLKAEHKIGLVAGSTSSSSAVSAKSTVDIVALRQKIVPLRKILCLADFERAAAEVLDAKSFAFYRTGADDERTLDWNRNSWKAVRFRPRILRPMTAPVDLTTQLFGQTFAAPFFIAPAGAGKLAHPEGEVLMTRAAAKQHMLQWVCNAAGCTQSEMAQAKEPKQVLFWQIYATRNLAVTEKEICDAVSLGYKGFCLTVDAIATGNRERDRRLAVQDEEEESGADPGGISARRAPVHGDFDWPSAIAWIRTLTDLPLAIKGIQTWEDAAMCLQFANVHPWLSNHGGRQLEGAPSALDTLLEIRRQCPELLVQRDVIVDGGVLRGTDVVKAICLGARAVGIGRPFLYALAYGEEGVAKALQILRDEVATTLALLGVGRIADLGPDYVDASAVAMAFASSRL